MAAHLSKGKKKCEDSYKEEIQFFNDTLNKVNRILGKRLEEGLINERQAKAYLDKIASLTPMQGDDYDNLYGDSVYRKLCKAKGEERAIQECHEKLQRIWADIYDAQFQGDGL